MKNLFLLIAIIAINLSLTAQNYEVKSPDNKLIATITLNETISFVVNYNDKMVAEAKDISLEISNRQILGISSKLKNKIHASVKNRIEAPLSTKSSVINDEYNLLTLQFKDNYALEFRVFNHGAAYRFITSINKDVIVKKENVSLNFDASSAVYFPEEESIVSHNERLYKYSNIGDIIDNKFCSLPLLVQSNGTNVLFTESDLEDYPGLYMEKEGSNSFGTLHPKYVLKTVPTLDSPDRNFTIEKEADYIAKTNGKRSFPWRIMIIGEDKDLIESTLVYQLSSPSKIDNIDWIKPGQIAWDWFNANNIYGVDFESGLNTQTYKYYIDFASENKIKYVVLDEGWSKTTLDITSPADNIDVKELIRYGKEKGVDIILWMLWEPLDKDIAGILAQYKSWGAAGIKIDFLQRADQYMVNYCSRVAKEAAKLKLLVDIHGTYKPSGLNREYPNVLTFEGVKGNENNKWGQDITPDHNLTLPFIRMVAGPMDYTPGVMSNTQITDYHISFDRPAGQGTRCHEVAKYVIFESPLQMLCDTPSRYKREKETLNIITQIPVVWDATKVIDAKISDYLVVARRSGDNWYIGAMTDWTARDFDIKLDFLSEGDYEVQIMQDGINANKFAEDYKLINTTVNKKGSLKAPLAKGGGWIAVLKKHKK